MFTYISSNLETKDISRTTAPKVFTLAYALIKPFLHEVTLKKIKIFGHSGWKEALLQDISPDQLPQHWGGSRTDPDGNPKCPSQVGDQGANRVTEGYTGKQFGSSINKRQRGTHLRLGLGTPQTTGRGSHEKGCTNYWLYALQGLTEQSKE